MNLSKRVVISMEMAIDLSTSTSNQTVRIINCSPTISKIEVHSIKSKGLIHRINYSERTYGILTLGKNDVTKSISVGEEILIKIGNEVYPKKVRTHKTNRGRIDGLTEFYRRYSINENDEFKIEYDTGKKLLILTPLS